MSSGSVQSEAHLRCVFLMNRIIKVRYTDMHAEKELCKELLSVAQPEKDPYAYAFANVYLFDSVLALENYEECMFYLNRATNACRKNNYDDLMLMLCNLAGLYFSKLNEVQISIQYYLEGISLVNKSDDYNMKSKLFNNIGAIFAARADWDSAKNYFLQAYTTLENKIDGENFGFAVSYLCNLSEAYQNVKMYEESEMALLKCNAIINRKSQYHSIRLACAWCTHYASVKDITRSIDYEERALENGLLTFENSYFVSDMCIGLFEVMMDIGEYPRAKLFMDTLNSMLDGAAVIVRHRYLRLTIRYFEACGDLERQNEAYREYYYSAKKIAKIDSKAQVLSLYGYVQAANAQKERERMHKSNSELELASQLDELTGLYNRRYLTKLESKLAQSLDVVRMGYIMLDIDYFKQYNDFYGHFQGDTALTTVAQVLKEHSAEGVHAGRYGGDEFVCLCINLTDDEIDKLVKNIVSALADKKIPHEKSLAADYLSVSAGYCNELVSPLATPKRLLKLADEALYKTKAAGKNGYTRLGLL